MKEVLGPDLPRPIRRHAIHCFPLSPQSEQSCSRWNWCTANWSILQRGFWSWHFVRQSQCKSPASIAEKWLLAWAIYIPTCPCLHPLWRNWCRCIDDLSRSESFRFVTLPSKAEVIWLITCYTLMKQSVLTYVCNCPRKRMLCTLWTKWSLRTMGYRNCSSKDYYLVTYPSETSKSWESTCCDSFY